MHASEIPSANCPLEEFLPFCCLVWLPVTTEDNFGASWRQAGNKSLARAGVVSKDSFGDVSGLKSSLSFLRELGR